MFVSVHLLVHLSGSSEEVWTFGLAASCSNNFLGTRQMLMHEKKKKKKHVPYIIRSPCLYMLYVKFGKNGFHGFRGDVVDNVDDDGPTDIWLKY